MHKRLTVLALAALLTVGTGSVVAASMDDPTADAQDGLPANYSLDVVNPDDIDGGEVDRAIETAWRNDTVRSYFEEDPSVHFEVWASELDDGIVHVDVASTDAPEETRVVAEADLQADRITSIDEPVALNVSQVQTMDVSDTDVHEVENGEEIVFVDDLTQSSVDPSTTVQREGNGTDGDGTLTVEFDERDTDDGAFGTHLSPAYLLAHLG